MVDVNHNTCAHDACTKRSRFNFHGSRTVNICKQHAKQGMVDMLSSRCSHESCSKRPSFNDVGSKTALNCKQQADDGMIDVRNMRCSQNMCVGRPLFNVLGSNKALYCKKHAKHGMVDVQHRRCLHNSCTGWPRWGNVGGLASVCSHHTSNLVAGSVVDLKQMCEVTSGRLVARWGLISTQPTLCAYHGRLQEGLFRVIGADRRSIDSFTLYYRAQLRPSIHVKTECSY